MQAVCFRRDAQFEAPFLISAGIYGGSGYLSLLGNGREIVGFEASFEFCKDGKADRQAALGMLFDLAGHRPGRRHQSAHAVRGPKLVVKTGKTTVLTGEQSRELPDSIDTSTAGQLA
jgi:hypothetical protein